jgi:hypothetical protein
MKKYFLFIITGFITATAFSQKNAGDTAHQNPTSGCTFSGVSTPQNYTACTGGNASFNVWVTPWADYKKWQESIDGGLTWTDIPGSDTLPGNNPVIFDTLVLTSVTAYMNNNRYRYVFDCGSGWVYSGVAVLTVVGAQSTMTSQPSDANACNGSNAVFNISVSGGSLSYQWQQSADGGTSFTNISGSISPQLQFNAVTQSMNGYKYRCIVGSDCSPTLTSDAAILNVSTDNIVITTQPTAQQACGINSSATFSVTVSGQPIAYQWQREKYGQNFYYDIPGANSSTSILTGLNSSNNNDSVRCKITRSCGSFIYSKGALLRVYFDPVITQQPVNVQSCTGSTANLIIWINSIIHPSVLNAQWEQSVDGGITFANATGATSSGYNPQTQSISYSLAFSVSSAAMNNYKFRCKLYNPCFTKYSDTVTLFLNIPPVVITQPIDKSVWSGSVVTFSAAATGSVTGNQWQVSTDGGNNFTDIPGAIYQPLFVTSGVPVSYNNNLYRCKFNSSCTAPVYSNAALLNVTQYSNLINDTCKSISCMACSTDISTIYNTAQYPVVVWTPPDPANATFGIYKLKVVVTGNCADSALISVYNDSSNITRGCFNGEIKISSNITGSTYQWQKRVNAYGNYTWNNLNTFESINPSGINTPVLTLPSGTYTHSNQFRCLVNGNTPSQVTTIKPSSFWTGAIDSNWSNPNNWSCGIVPYEYAVDVFIYPGKPNYPVINSIIRVRSLTLFPGAIITVNSGGQIILTGNY